MSEQKTRYGSHRKKKRVEEGAVHGTLVVADKQTAGRGRRGRAWISPAGAPVYMSLLLRPQCNPDKASAITLVSALAIVQAARELRMQDCGIKWPNDVVANGKKLCGILTEMSAEIDAIHYVVPGIGINVNQEVFDDEIAKTGTSFFPINFPSCLSERAIRSFVSSSPKEASSIFTGYSVISLVKARQDSRTA